MEKAKTEKGIIYFMSPGNDAPEQQALRQALEEKQDPAGDPKVKEYFAAIQDLHSRNEERGFADLDYEELQQITSDVIEKLPEQLQPLAADLAENYADVAKVTAVYSKVRELQEEWELIEAIKKNLEKPEPVLTLNDYTLNNSLACVEFLRLLPHITELNIENIGAGNVFSGIGNLQNLQTICVEDARNFNSFRGIEALTHLQFIKLTNRGAPALDLAPLRSIDSLQTVTINGRDVDWRSGHDIEEPGLLEILLAGMPAGMLVGMPPTVLANLPANVLAAMPDGLLAALQPDIPNGLGEVPEDRLDDLQELPTTTTGGTTASAFRPTTSSAESVNSPFLPAELGQVMVADGNLQLGTSYSDSDHSPDGRTLSLESLYFRRRAE